MAFVFNHLFFLFFLQLIFTLTLLKALLFIFTNVLAPYLLRAWTNDECLATKHHQTLFGDQTFYRLDTWFGAVWSCLIVFDRVWSCLIQFEGHQAFDQKRETFLLFACLMGNVLFVWTAAYQTCLMRACVPRLLSGLYQLFHLYLIKHVFTVWPLTSTLSCLVTKQCLMVFGRQTFIVCPGP